MIIILEVFLWIIFSCQKKYVLTINEVGVSEEHETAKGFIDCIRLLDCSHYFEMIESKEISAMLPRILKKLFDTGVVIPAKMRFCNGCNAKVLCDECENQVNEIKKCEANLNLLKRPPSNLFGHMLPFCNK